MNNELIERYIHAVIKKLPYKARPDIKSELSTLIEDMLEARCGDVKPTDRDIRVILTELGTPSELAAKYRQGGERCLIGPAYYENYRTVLLIVLASTAFGITLASAINVGINGTANLFVELLGWLGTLFISVISAFGFVTLIFAAFERKGVKVNMNESLDNLPPVPKKQETISRGETIAEIVFSVVFCAVFLAVPQIIVVAREGMIIPIFNAEWLRGSWYLLVGFCAVGILKSSFELYEGRYTRRLAALSAILNVVSAGLAWAFLSNGSIMNPELAGAISGMFSKEVFIEKVFVNFNLFFLAIILFALVLDTATTAYRAFKYDRK